MTSGCNQHQTRLSDQTMASDFNDQSNHTYQYPKYSVGPAGFFSCTYSKDFTKVLLLMPDLKPTIKRFDFE